MADPPPFRRTPRRLLRYGAPLLAAGALAGVLLLPFGSELPRAASPEDPTRFGPERTLTLTRCELVQSPRGDQALVVAGSTNLPPGVSLELTVRSGGAALLSHRAQVGEGSFELRLPGRGHATPGAYEVVARFRLEDQPQQVQEALHYQPRQLVAHRVLVIPERGAGQSLQARFERLFQAVNAQPRDEATLARLDQQARSLSQELWLAKQKAALGKLRRALDVARRPPFQRREFDRLLIEAHVLAGL